MLAIAYYIQSRNAKPPLCSETPTAHIKKGPFSVLSYHSRRFELDGRLRHMPGFEGARDFPSASDDLPQLALGDWAGHAFTSLFPRWPLTNWLGDMHDRLAWLPINTWCADASRSRSFEFDAHWALYVENYLEGLHIPFVHPALNRTLDMSAYHYELGRASVQWLFRR